MSDKGKTHAMANSFKDTGMLFQMWKYKLARMRGLIILVCLITSSGTGRAQPARYDSLGIPSLMKEAHVVGLSMAVVEKGAIVWAKGFGVRSSIAKLPVNENTVFEAASLSKPIFAYAVLQLVDAGVLDLDAPLADVFEYADLSTEPQYADVTARMVLSHTSGLPNWRPRNGLLRFSAAPGSRFEYSGEGYVLLQRAIEHLTGESIESVIEERVFTPLGMTSSSFVWQHRFVATVAIGHLADGTALEKGTPKEPNAAFSLHTTSTDYARFLIAVMNGEGLSTEMNAAMRQAQADADAGMQWSLGWGIQTTESGTALWHWGDNRGYKAFAIVYPKTRRGMVVLTNSDNGMLILDALLDRTMGGGQPVVDWLGYDQYDDPAYQVTQKLLAAFGEGGAAAAETAYHRLKNEGAFPAEAFEEDMLNALGYRLLGDHKVEAAIAMFKLNVEQFPNAANAYDSLGEAYMIHGDRQQAIENYERSVALDPANDNGRAMLRRLRTSN